MSDPSAYKKPLPRWHQSDAVRVAMIAGFFSVVSAGAAIFAAWTAYDGRRRELDIKFVEIGIAILRAEPRDENTKKIRAWAVDIVDLNAPKERKFTREEREQLLGSKLDGSFYADFGRYDNTWGSSDYVPLRDLNSPHDAKTPPHRDEKNGTRKQK